MSLRYVLVVALVAVPLVAIACGSKPAPDAATPPSSARTANVVSATVVANECGAVNKAYAKLAEDAMHKLVEGCTSVPGGSHRFVATLQPGGRIEIAQSGDAEVVPICVLKNELRHKVPLAKPCTLEVRLDEGAVALPDAGAD